MGTEYKQGREAQKERQQKSKVESRKGSREEGKFTEITIYKAYILKSIEVKGEKETRANVGKHQWE